MERIKAAAPNTKFILFLREPISRAYSHWNMVTQNMRQEHYSFNECVDRELTTLMTEPKTFNNALLHYVQRGFYMDQIEAFLKIFPREQLLVVIAERIRKDPVEEHKRIFEFLGVEATEIVAEDKHLGNYKEKTVPPKTKARLDALYAPHNERLYEFLGERITEWEEPEPVAVEDSDKDGKEEDKDESESKEVDVEEAAKKEWESRTPNNPLLYFIYFILKQFCLSFKCHLVAGGFQGFSSSIKSDIFPIWNIIKTFWYSIYCLIIKTIPKNYHYLVRKRKERIEDDSDHLRKRKQRMLNLLT